MLIFKQSNFLDLISSSNLIVVELGTYFYLTFVEIPKLLRDMETLLLLS